jgi:hypothetical protein
LLSPNGGTTKNNSIAEKKKQSPLDSFKDSRSRRSALSGSNFGTVPIAFSKSDVPVVDLAKGPLASAFLANSTTSNSESGNAIIANRQTSISQS